jgi:hypothetical protein
MSLIMVRWYLLGIGLPTGLMVGFGLAVNGPQTSWLDFAVTVTVTAVAMAAVVGGTVELYVSYVPRSLPGVAGLILVALGTTVVGGILVLSGAARFPHGRWVRLPDLPEHAEAFVGPTCSRLTGEGYGIVLVATPGGGYLKYDPLPTGAGTWNRVAAIPPEVLERAEGCRPSPASPEPPSISGVVVDRHHIYDDGADCVGTRHYVLKDDSSVWSWSTGGCAIGVFAILALYVLLICALGLTVGIARLSEHAPRPWLSRRGGARTPPKKR